MSETEKLKMPTLFISHGGGPWPYIPEMRVQFAKTAQWLMDLPKTLPQKPKAVLSISGHWEESVFTVSSATQPPMIYDYSGFPEHTYQIKYSAPGSAEVAHRVQNLLSQAGIENHESKIHGFDHGTFVPMVMMYPQADVPVVSMSMQANYDPLNHIRMGQALQALRNEGVLIVGSGLSYHNMRGFGSAAAGPIARQFSQWLTETISESDSEIRNKKLQEWEQAPAARAAHPQEDHLIPLMVVSGVAGKDVGNVALVDNVFGVDMVSYRF